MKIGFRKPPLDLSMKHIAFETDGKRHIITFRFSHWRGITDVRYDDEVVKILSAHPPFLDVLQECALTLRIDIKHLWAIVHRKIVYRRKARNRLDQK